MAWACFTATMLQLRNHGAGWHSRTCFVRRRLLALLPLAALTVRIAAHASQHLPKRLPAVVRRRGALGAAGSHRCTPHRKRPAALLCAVVSVRHLRARPTMRSRLRGSRIHAWEQSTYHGRVAGGSHDSRLTNVDLLRWIRAYVKCGDCILREAFHIPQKAIRSPHN